MLILKHSVHDRVIQIRDLTLLKQKLLQKIPFILPFFQRRFRLCGVVVVGHLTVVRIGVKMSPLLKKER